MTLIAFALSCVLAAQPSTDDPDKRPAAAPDGKQLFAMYCAACHKSDRFHVGPSAVEMRKLYEFKPAEFMAWCKNPQPKRKGVIRMPPMAFLTDAQLRAIHAFVIASTKGKTEAKVKDNDKFRASPSMRRRPLVQRIFMPNAGPAAIAVAIDDRHHFCWDAGECRLRYVWLGDFIDGWPVWRGNGNALAKILGDVVLREAESPLPTPNNATRKFLGYRMRDGLPTFQYRIGKVEIEEHITRDRAPNTLARQFTLRNAPADWKLEFTSSERVAYRSSDGTFTGAVFAPAEDKRESFTVLMEITP